MKQFTFTRDTFLSIRIRSMKQLDIACCYIIKYMYILDIPDMYKAHTMLDSLCKQIYQSIDLNGVLNISLNCASLAHPFSLAKVYSRVISSNKK